MPRKVYGVNIAPAPSPCPARARYHHGNLRAALVEAALSRLEDSTQAELSLRELARNVGVTVNAAYRHFKDKEALLSAVSAEGFRRFAAAQRDAARARPEPRQALLAQGKAYVRFALEHPALFRLMFGRFDQERQDGELVQASQDAFAGLLESVARARSLPTDHPEARSAALHAWALVHGLSHLMLDHQLDRMSAAPERLIAAVLLDADAKSAQPRTPRRRK